MSINRQVKSNLAKLLATENLTVEHAHVPTASFDVQNRVLSLPIWDDVSDDVYDLLVGHEVGHAIYTPNEWGTDHGVPQSYLNVVEDARIEKLMKTKYPGLTKSFYRGYSELNDQDFFEIKEQDLSKFSLIDRINLYFKIGIHDISMIVPFTEKEEFFIPLIKQCQTFDDVVDICKQLVDFVKENKKDSAQTSSVQNNPANNSNSASGSLSDQQQESNESDETKENETDTSGDQLDDIDGGKSFSVGEEDDGDEDTEDIDESVTDDAWQKNQQKLISKDPSKYYYITPPQVNWNDYIISIDEFSSDIDKALEEQSQKTYFSYGGNEIPIGQQYIDSWKSLYLKFKPESNKSVSYLMKEFEMKKRASEYNRASVSKTGVLDTNKLFSYKWSDDVFKKTSVFPSGKNHGLLMFVDWSGSMHENLDGTIKQLINLVSFCNRIKIPFQVFSFLDNSSTVYMSDYNNPVRNFEVSVSSKFRLVEIFNSNVKSKEFDKQIQRVWNLVKMLNSGNSSVTQKYDLGSTPLNETIFAAVHIYKEFKKKFNVEKLNTVFLTDGESNHLNIAESRKSRYTDDTYYARKPVAYYDGVVCLKDPKTGYVDININQSTHWQEDGFSLTARLLNYYKWVTGSNVIGFRLSSPGGCRNIISIARKVSDTNIDKTWKNEKYFIAKNLGYDELYVIQTTQEFNGKVSEIKADHTSTSNKLRNEFRKHVKSKMFNKIILSKFIDQIA